MLPWIDRARKRIPVHVAALLCTATVCFDSASAALIELERNAFDDAMAGQARFVEDFEAYTLGLQASPMFFSNGLRFDNPAPFVTESGGSGRVVIGNNLPLTEPRMFTRFATDASLVGFDLIVDEGDEFDVTVTTTGGDMLFIEARRGKDFEGFFGFSVLSDSVASLMFASVGGSSGPGSGGGGISNFAFDNFTVNAVAPVPLPPSLALTLAPLAILAQRARKSPRS